ncbi:phage minor capsid protein [Aeromicrobium sp. 9AM]|uniref:phage minor capsid protein n=1 Tax=Aeromicrobium sp. 9AM TaxID=2653126 RepID=UPI0012F2A216|nr:phage minor capsid protein [Aeromicrobium sp. 9AM]VXB82283.1 Minor capsid protein [Aeromicrobium sp. 9AM]
MPVSPSYTENLSAGVAAHYQEAERRLLLLIAGYLKKDMDAPDWAELKLLQVQLLQAQARGLLDRTGRQVAAELALTLSKAANRGTAVAMADLAELIRQGLVVPPALPAVEALVGETIRATVGTHPHILRQTLDTYRAVVASTSPQVLLGTQTRLQAAQSALDAFANRGISGFIDQAGRNWALESYAEMATRTATSKAVTSAYRDQMVAAGEDLVIVSDAPQECELCEPWEGKILSLTGAPRIDDIEVEATLDEAEDEGLFHPNCRHSIALYQPGVTEVPTDTADPEGDRARQELRRLERGVRQWKRRSAAALDDNAKAAADAKVRDWQARIRKHVDETPAKRQPQRERLGAL